ncbi:MAG TPA: hypothetical protein VLK82_04755 [Candidatus Tectomicrobia bacterium]|nr:hypothetical protein [Candidatus Tectomicrobia bacterium]
MTEQDMRLCREISCVDDVTEVDPVGGQVMVMGRGEGRGSP